jgi:glycosyltransferase involved in cell wall biosynthesis
MERLQRLSGERNIASSACDCEPSRRSRVDAYIQGTSPASVVAQTIWAFGPISSAGKWDRLVDYSHRLETLEETEATNGIAATFIVFAYNQQELVRQAVEGALSQTYGPLEIVLSDDCSTDRTFDVMSEIASGYAGPHTVRLVRNPTNLGVLDHAIARGKEASGEIVICSAGDDVSEPERVERVMEAFGTNLNVGCVFSGVSVIDERGEIIDFESEYAVSKAWDGRLLFMLDDRRNTAVRGCSAAYRKWVFDVPLSAASLPCAEDSIFSFYLNLLDADIISLKSPLVRYRRHSGALTNFLECGQSEIEVREHRLTNARAIYLDEIEKIANALGRGDAVDMVQLNRTRAFFQDVVAWPALTFAQRLMRSLDFDRRGDLKPILRRSFWKITRLWGQYPRYQPKTWLSRFQGRCR